MPGTSMESLVTSIEVEREHALKAQERAKQTIAGILAAARSDGRSNLSDEEQAEVRREFENHSRAERDVAGIDIKLANARKLQQLELATDVKLHERSPVEDG